MNADLVRIENELSLETIQKLANCEIAAIHVKDFYPAELCNLVSKRVLNSSDLDYYNKEFVNDVARLYLPYADAHGDAAAERAYHVDAIASIHATRALFYPHMSPMDHIRLLLEEYWPGGVALQKFHGKKCFGGILRVFEPGGAEFHAHYDRLEEETDAPEAKDIQQQFGMNIYLQVPDKGGDLQMWLREATLEERKHVRQSEGIPHGSVEPPYHTIHPEAGDMIMMSTRLLHAVTPGVETARISIGSFIGCYGEERPLTIWS